MKEGCAVEEPSRSVVMETAEVTGLKLPVSVCDVCFVFPPGVSVVVGAVGTSDVMGGVLLTVEEDEMLPVEAEDVGTSDDVEGLWLTREGDGLLAVAEVAVSWEMSSVGVYPLAEDEGVDVIPGEIVLVCDSLLVSMV